MSAHRKRKKLFVDPAVQGCLAKRLTFHWIVFFAIVISLQFLMTWMMNPVLSLGDLVPKIVQNNGLFLLAVLLLLPSFVFDSLKLSNRFAGPMVRLRNALKEVADGDELKEIKFRDGDFWLEMADEYNAMIRNVKSRIESSNPGETDLERESEEATTQSDENELAPAPVA